MRLFIDMQSDSSRSTFRLRCVINGIIVALHGNGGGLYGRPNDTAKYIDWKRFMVRCGSPNGIPKRPPGFHSIKCHILVFLRVSKQMRVVETDLIQAKKCPAQR